jgi:serine phosphatase RsbU (regulator of sigma subunit)
VEFVPDPAAAVSRINDHMCAKAVEGRFVTFVLVVLNTRTHTMWVVNAGHMSPLVRHADGTVEELDESAVGVPLGVVEDFEYQAVESALKAGDCVVIYTDGVSEAMNPGSDLYGLDRLRTFVARSSGKPAEVGPAIREDVKRHAAGRAQNDDITLMVFGRVRG